MHWIHRAAARICVLVVLAVILAKSPMRTSPITLAPDESSTP